MSCTEVYFAPRDGCCSMGNVAVEERKFRSFCSHQIHFGVELLIGHSRGPSRCAPDK